MARNVMFALKSGVVVWSSCLMLRRLLRQLVSAVKDLKMSELTQVETPPKITTMKRSTDDPNGTEAGSKKMKTDSNEVSKTSLLIAVCATFCQSSLDPNVHLCPFLNVDCCQTLLSS